MGAIRRLTFEERQEIEKYLKLGLNCHQISKLLHRSRTGIRTEILLSPKPYEAVTAQKRSETAWIIRNKNISNKLKGVKKYSSNIALQEKISLIEMQLEIITTFIKEQQNGKTNQ